jgi:hypothetical protein
MPASGGVAVASRGIPHSNHGAQRVSEHRKRSEERTRVFRGASRRRK